MWIGIIMVGVAALVALVAWGYPTWEQKVRADAARIAIDNAKKQIEQDKENEIAALKLSEAVARRDAQYWQKRYGQIKTLIAQKAKEADNITRPESANETRNRFLDLGYPPRPKR